MIDVSCPRCGRVRSVNERTRAARAWATPTAERTRYELGRLTCATCHALASVEQHTAAIEKLYRFIGERRMRGL